MPIPQKKKDWRDTLKRGDIVSTSAGKMRDVYSATYDHDGFLRCVKFLYSKFTAYPDKHPLKVIVVTRSSLGTRGYKKP